MTFKFKCGDKVRACRKETEHFEGFDFEGEIVNRANSDDPEYWLKPPHPKVFCFWEEELTLLPPL